MAKIAVHRNFKTLSKTKIKGIKNFTFSMGNVRWGIPSGILYSALMLIFGSKVRMVDNPLISDATNVGMFSLISGSLFGFVRCEVLKKKIF